MKVASVSEAKNSLSALLDRVKAGESVVIVDRGIPVARLEPLPVREQDGGRRVRLERAGTVRRGTNEVFEALEGEPAQVARGHGRAALDALIDERGDGR